MKKGTWFEVLKVEHRNTKKLTSTPHTCHVSHRFQGFPAEFPPNVLNCQPIFVLIFPYLGVCYLRVYMPEDKV